MIEVSGMVTCEIIDNGFNVSRVRLTNEDGQVFKDIVQDGLILFVSVQRSEVRFPLLASIEMWIFNM